MKIRLACKLPKEVVIGFGYGLVPIIIIIAAYFGLAYLAGIIGAPIVSVVGGAWQEIVAAVTNNILLDFLIIIGFICAVCGWVEEDHEAGREISDRSDTIALALLVSALIGAMVSFFVVTAILTNQVCLSSTSCRAAVGFSWTIFIQGTLLLFGGFIIGWLGHWCKRCIRIEKGNGLPEAGNEGS